MTSTDALRDAFVNLSGTECRSIARGFLAVRDKPASGSRADVALADVYTLIAGAATDAADQADRDFAAVLQGEHVAKRSRRGLSLGHDGTNWEADDASHVA